MIVLHKALFNPLCLQRGGKKEAEELRHHFEPFSFQNALPTFEFLPHVWAMWFKEEGKIHLQVFSSNGWVVSCTVFLTLYDVGEEAG